MKSRIFSALLFAAAAAGVAGALLKLPHGYLETNELDVIAVIASPPLFLLACVLAFFKPHLSYGAGLVAGLSALPWFVETEFLNFEFANSWIVFNCFDSGFGAFADALVFSRFKIVAAALLLIVIALCTLRLLPARWRVRNLPVCQRTWPAFAVCLLALVLWFRFAVTPYRIPMIVDGAESDLTILHVEKRGLQFHEARISIFKDRRFHISQNDRRLFHYRFGESYFEGFWPETMYHKALVLTQLPGFTSLRNAPPQPLRKWNAEGWYVLRGFPDDAVLAFSSENGIEPPQGAIDLLQEIKASASAENWTRGGLRDVCLGFCYDPTAGLGVMAVNERCRSDQHGTHCK
jgi:hypothetical protein